MIQRKAAIIIIIGVIIGFWSGLFIAWHVEKWMGISEWSILHGWILFNIIIVSPVFGIIFGVIGAKYYYIKAVKFFFCIYGSLIFLWTIYKMF